MLSLFCVSSQSLQCGMAPQRPAWLDDLWEPDNRLRHLSSDAPSDGLQCSDFKELH